MSNQVFTLSEFEKLDRTLLANHVFARTIDGKIAIRVTSCQIPTAPETVGYTGVQYDSNGIAIGQFENGLLKSVLPTGIGVMVVENNFIIS